MYRIDVFAADTTTNAQALGIEDAIEGALGRTWDETDGIPASKACVYRIYCRTEHKALEIAKRLRHTPAVHQIRVSYARAN